jgi:hypothetical protein
VIAGIPSEFHFGFDVGIAGMFHKTNSGLMLNWERFHRPKDSDSFTVSNDAYIIGPFFEIGPDASLYKSAKGSVRFKFDEVNLDFGTFIDIGSRLHTNLLQGRVLRVLLRICTQHLQDQILKVRLCVQFLFLRNLQERGLN